jgi:hypothetical protein
MPKLREVSISAIRVEWALAAAISFKNLRKLEIGNWSSRNSPSIEQFSALSAASPKLEILDVSGCEPGWDDDDSVQAQLPLVHLPKLKRFRFGWTFINSACIFLKVLQIPETPSLTCIVDMVRPERNTQQHINEYGAFQISSFLQILDRGTPKTRISRDHGYPCLD